MCRICRRKVHSIFADFVRVQDVRRLESRLDAAHEREALRLQRLLEVWALCKADAMLADIRAARAVGADGVVVGCLTPDGDLDLPLLQRLLDEAKGMSVTFHRAFDRCRQPLQALDQLIALGVDRVLTSGQQPTAPEGADLLRQLVARADGRIAIMAGCGVNETNIRALAEATGVTEFHFSAREAVASAMRLRNDEVKMGSSEADEYSRMVTTARRVRATIAQLDANY